MYKKAFQLFMIFLLIFAVKPVRQILHQNGTIQKILTKNTTIQIIQWLRKKDPLHLCTNLINARDLAISETMKPRVQLTVRNTTTYALKRLNQFSFFKKYWLFLIEGGHPWTQTDQNGQPYYDCMTEEMPPRQQLSSNYR